MATSQENTSILTSADPKEEEKKEEEEKPLLDLQIDSDADGGSPALPSPPPEYTITLVNATHHPFPTQTTFIATNYLAILPFETTLRMQYLKMLRTRLHSAILPADYGATKKFMGEVKNVLTKLADFKEKIKKSRREVKAGG
ncbi:MAG: hypothetical protein LQ350_005487 [Teloschistes chrysophthalmus]|nr:MAG: hypothetical protein LQ350_005487 [Niorma chrysophthalma]